MLNAAEAEPLPLYPSSPYQGKVHIEERASFSPDAAGAAALAFAEPVARAQTRHAAEFANVAAQPAISIARIRKKSPEMQFPTVDNTIFRSHGIDLQRKNRLKFTP